LKGVEEACNTGNGRIAVGQGIRIKEKVLYE